MREVSRLLVVMPGQKREARLRADDPAIHQNQSVFHQRWIAGSSPAMTRRAVKPGNDGQS
jgi:hypothetical protein